MSHTNANKIQAAMIALDQGKAFERVNWNFLFKALQHYGFAPVMIEKIKTVYQNIETDQGKRTLVASFSSEQRTVAKMPNIYDSVNYT